jgi:hypothetical protein
LHAHITIETPRINHLPQRRWHQKTKNRSGNMLLRADAHQGQIWPSPGRTFFLVNRSSVLLLPSPQWRSLASTLRYQRHQFRICKSESIMSLRVTGQKPKASMQPVVCRTRVSARHPASHKTQRECVPGNRAQIESQRCQRPSSLVLPGVCVSQCCWNVARCLITEATDYIAMQHSVESFCI